MTLAEYIEEKLYKERRLNAEQIQRNSKGAITAAYIRQIVSGKRKDPSLKKLIALADGGGVNRMEVIRVAGNLPEDEEWNPEVLLEVLAKIIGSPELTEAIKILVKKKPREMRAALSMLKAKGPKPD